MGDANSKEDTEDLIPTKTSTDKLSDVKVLKEVERMVFPSGTEHAPEITISYV